MLLFAWNNLWRERLRFGITVGGVAMAVLLILAMNGLFASSGRQITAYIDRSNADLFIAQAGVRNMHMATSVLPPEIIERVRKAPGVERVEPITYFQAMLEWQGEGDLLYAIGLGSDARMGGPWSMAAGKAVPGPGEIVVSERQRKGESPRLGDIVSVGGQELRVVGLSRETKSLASSLVFLNDQDTAAMRGEGRVNYLLVRTRPGMNVEAVAEEIRRQVPEAAVLTRQEMSQSDREIALQMGVEILAIMSAVGFLIGLAVVTLTIYAATVAQIRQYAVLKAIGAGPGPLFAAVASQGLSAAAAGFGLGLLLTLGLSALVPLWSPGLEIDVVPAYSIGLFGLILLMGLLASIPSFWRVLQADPITVFRP